MIARVFIEGIPVDRVTMSETIEWIASRIAERRQGSYMAVLNVAKLVKAQHDSDLRNALLEADIVTADGMPLVWCSPLYGERIPERVSGFDIMVEMFRRGGSEGWSFYLLGATEEVLRSTVDYICARHPGIRIAGYQHGYFTSEEETNVVDDIRASRSDVLLLAFGTPKKEHFVRRWRAHLGVSIIHGVGGSFDVLAGVTRRAPRWMQRMGLEWLYRLGQEPRRMFPRYFVTNSLFIAMIIAQLVRKVGRRALG